MDEAKEVGTGEIEQLSMQINGHPRDLLQRFMARNHRPNEFTAATEEIELNLGLSLGGRFGVDPKDSKLLRSSSIAGFTTLVRDDDFPPPPSVSCHGVITRTCSLPTEIEEEQRKRKELQSLRRMEAKRKRSEKRNFRAYKDRSSSLERNCEEDKRVEDENGLISMGLKAKVESNSLAKQQQQPQQQQQEYMVKNGLLNSSVAPAFGLPSWVAPVARAASLPHGFDGITNGKASFLTAAGLRGFPTPSSQGSLGSQGSSSSGISEFDSRPAVQGSSSNCAEARSPASVQSLPEQNDQKAVPTPGTTIAENRNKLARAEMENQSKRPKVIDGSVMRETGRNVMEDMPCVSTKGDGPNGRRIEGFLYKYRKGEEVRIVCVCHGSFLTPAEFVKHAGGGDVAHPLRHIIVNPSSTFL